MNPMYLYQESEPIDGEDIKSYESTDILLNGERYNLEAIGYSHRITHSDGKFCEILSSEQIDDKKCLQKLYPGESKQVSFNCEIGAFCTYLTVRDISVFSPNDEYILLYKFGDKAYTAVEKLSDLQYKTYHTYPEDSACVVTITTFVPRHSLNI